MPLLDVVDLHVHFATFKGTLRAVDGVSFVVERGESLGLVGESGCGKSTLAKALLRLVAATSGRIVFDGLEVGALAGRELRTLRRRLQIVFQDPYGSLNPRQTIGDILNAPLVVHGVGERAARRRIVAGIVERVGLSPDALARYPHEFSGGQRQRIGIARALILSPELVVCDEPVSALDLSIQAQILNLLVEMKSEFGLSYLFISHDLSVVRFFSDWLLVMYLGRIVESADARALWAAPRHPYTQALIDSAPDPARRRSAAPLAGDLPSPENVPAGCRFHPRCPKATAICRAEEPAPRAISVGHAVACHHAAA